jgi:hypothetical protein
MEVDVQLETAAEALDHRDGAGLAVRDAESSRRARVEGEQCPGIHAQHRATQGVIPGQAVAQAIGQREHPLAHRHPRQQVVDEGGRVLRHPPPPQLEQKPREGHEPLERTLRTPKPREAFGQDPATQEVAELVLDKGRQAVAVSAIRDFSQEGLQVLTNDGVEHGVLGVTRPTRGVGMRHALA